MSENYERGAPTGVAEARASEQPEGAAAAPPVVIRTPDQRLRVFVSSTLGELAEERVAARAAITKLRLTPVLFELGARPHPPRDLYRAYLEQSHIFIGIYWQRYGWVAPTMTISGLEDEYLLSGDRPKLIYIKTPAPDIEPRLADLLQRIEKDDRASYKFFTTTDELRELIENDLALLLTERFESARVAEAASPPKPSLKNVPAPATPLVGRDREVEAVRDLLARPGVRLVTLSGPGGIGKSRVAFAVAACVAERFAEGVVFVSLASVADPALTVNAIAAALGVREEGGRSLLEDVKAALREKELLLLLDNFEHLIPAAPIVAELLRAAPDLKVLVTSRSILRLTGEHEYPIPPLTLPSSADLARLRDDPTAVLSQYSAVELFIQRARAVKPDFEVTSENAAAVAEICARLDGIPLAIELAAARIKVLSPQALLVRLGSRLELLTGGARDLPARQKTMRATIAWSYDLLDDAEKRLFQRLSVFAGGATLEAAEAICNPNGDLGVDVLDGIASLVDESLLQEEDGGNGEIRFTMLGTIREYGLERLKESGEAEAIHRQHANYYLRLASRLKRRAESDEQGGVIARLDIERDNLWAALEWSQAEFRGVKSAPVEPGDYAAARAPLAESLPVYREMGDSWGLAFALKDLGSVAYRQGAYEVARSSLEESVAIFREMCEKWGLAQAAGLLSEVERTLGRYQEATTLGEESLALAREMGYREAAAWSLRNLGFVAQIQGDYQRATDYFEQSLAIFREDGDKQGLAWALNHLGDVHRDRGNDDRAAALYEESLALFREVGHAAGVAAVLHNLGYLAQRRGDLPRAARLFAESLSLSHEIGNEWSLAGGLAGMAAVEVGLDRPERAARLLSVAYALRDAIDPDGRVVDATNRREWQRTLDRVRGALSGAAFDAAWSEGRKMTVEQAIAAALTETASA